MLWGISPETAEHIYNKSQVMMETAKKDSKINTVGKSR